MTPFEANKKLILNQTSRNIEMTKFQMGDYVRVPDKRNIFSKGYTTNWNEELFKMQKIISTNPIYYPSEDENNEQIEGKYCEQELPRGVFILNVTKRC